MFVIVMIDLQRVVLDRLEKEVRENIVRNAAEGVRKTLMQELKRCEEMMLMYSEKTLIFQSYSSLISTMRFVFYAH